MTETTNGKIPQYTSEELCIDEEYGIDHSDINHMADEEQFGFESCQQVFDYNRNIPGEEILGSQLESDLVRAVEDQFLQQNSRNENIQDNMQQLAESYDEIQRLKGVISSLKRQLKELSSEIEINKDANGRYKRY
ncbi:hypothetical protein N7509_012370 [Penicillium cosmopolitanum]|uniref:Uncharacterized protein n=1 Tax=Penicillium cosmopolitanum TaxID=1131564 RepID=A0A9W9SII7_9EURO|nr:uncharacterized protein N7509_012370 [Penicillium cosmopolitanum]KAJ5379251.1 hypothetical protein N7509_012370 [Penicillium cosmopolitanum]